ncbi:Hypothetical protein EUBREC_3200 [Agathobacter rectalis ATCC 33656]|uniref:Uncharacterized protein n=1 Tax=Agathobacter rectalis (strain ATCC 33656 / DSM 3377 / JCM 17463 / KCTC 5835 / VPI 0990) TaxID=515619 RepID=C4ZDF1_AGARV|nr:Hypothetical protein EUBREC_3200 [Agathobacter rectalis ATCC 33656]
MFYYYGFARNILNCRRAYSCSEEINIVFFLRNILYVIRHYRRLYVRSIKNRRKLNWQTKVNIT